MRKLSWRLVAGLPNGAGVRRARAFDRMSRGEVRKASRSRVRPGMAPAMTQLIEPGT